MAHNVIIKWSPKNHEAQYEASGKHLQKMPFSDSSGTNKHSDAVSIILTPVQGPCFYSAGFWFKSTVSPLQAKRSL